MSFGEQMRRRREELGLTRQALADRLGVSVSAVGNYETGISAPKEEVLLRLFDALEAEPNYLYRGSYRAASGGHSSRRASCSSSGPKRDCWRGCGSRCCGKTKPSPLTKHGPGWRRWASPAPPTPPKRSARPSTSSATSNGRCRAISLRRTRSRPRRAASGPARSSWRRSTPCPARSRRTRSFWPPHCNKFRAG